MWAYGRERKCGYIFDLRVSPTHQGRGFGKWLATSTEQRCTEAGIEVLYLSVNRTNKVARRLYASLGWEPASPRLLHFRPLILLRPAPSELNVRRLDRTEAIKMVASRAAVQFLAPSAAECEALFCSPLYLATFECSDGALVHLHSLALSSGIDHASHVRRTREFCVAFSLEWLCVYRHAADKSLLTSLALVSKLNSPCTMRK